MYKLLCKVKNEFYSYASPYPVLYKQEEWTRPKENSKLYCFKNINETMKFLILSNLIEDYSKLHKSIALFDCSVINPDIRTYVPKDFIINVFPYKLPQGTIGCDAIKVHNEYKLDIVYKVVRLQDNKMYSANYEPTKERIESGVSLEYKLNEVTIPKRDKIFVFKDFHSAKLYNFYGGLDSPILKCIGVNSEEYKYFYREEFGDVYVPSGTYLSDYVFPFGVVNV